MRGSASACGSRMKEKAMTIGRVIIVLAAVVVLGTAPVAPAQTLSGDVLQDWQRMK